MSMRTNRIFISNCSADDEIANKVAHDLRRELGDDNVWHKSVRGGQIYQEVTNQGLIRSRFFIILLSPEAKRQVAIKRNIRMAVRKNKIIIPLICRACPIPPELEECVPIDFIFPKSYEVAFEELRIALGLPARFEKKETVKTTNGFHSLGLSQPSFSQLSTTMPHIGTNGSQATVQLPQQYFSSVQEQTASQIGMNSNTQSMPNISLFSLERRMKEAFDRQEWAYLIEKGRELSQNTTPSILRLVALAYYNRNEISHAKDVFEEAISLAYERDYSQSLVLKHEYDQLFVKPYSASNGNGYAQQEYDMSRGNMNDLSTEDPLTGVEYASSHAFHNILHEVENIHNSPGLLFAALIDIIAVPLGLYMCFTANTVILWTAVIGSAIVFLVGLWSRFDGDTFKRAICAALFGGLWGIIGYNLPETLYSNSMMISFILSLFFGCFSFIWHLHVFHGNR
jgi:hypothetical protein